MTFKGAVNSATDNRVIRGIARAGYAISGALHILVAYMILRVALGAQEEADQAGALATLATQGGGALSLWVVAAGLVALALGRLAETVLGLHPGECVDAHRRQSPIMNRLKAFGLSLVYSAVAFTAIQFALGARRQGSRQTAGLSARLMHSEGGKTILVIAGVVVAAIGAYYVHKGASRKFLDDLRLPGGRLV